MRGWTRGAVSTVGLSSAEVIGMVARRIAPMAALHRMADLRRAAIGCASPPVTRVPRDDGGDGEPPRVDRARGRVQTDGQKPRAHVHVHPEFVPKEDPQVRRVESVANFAATHPSCTQLKLRCARGTSSYSVRSLRAVSTSCVAAFRTRSSPMTSSKRFARASPNRLRCAVV